MPIPEYPRYADCENVLAEETEGDHWEDPEGSEGVQGWMRCARSRAPNVLDPYDDQKGLGCGSGWQGGPVRRRPNAT